ncbi:TPA: hypothetical protein JG832_002476 [Enterobacter hormaechei subsp. xiangfangensis]|nr:hypothetical protein [Enterobacter hormaechei subsp. xiangfangensis]HAV1890611.1 hypothetical protein [Enterobacter hormaechei subsp. xiangfangensis]
MTTNINYEWLGVSGAIVFPDGTGLDDEAMFTVNGDLDSAALVDELSEARYMNNGNLALARDYTQPVTPGELITALSILGWNCTPDPELQSELDRAELADLGDAVN